MLWRPHELTQPLVHRPSAGPEYQARKGLAGKPASVKGPAQEIDKKLGEEVSRMLLAWWSAAAGSVPHHRGLGGTDVHM